MHEVVAQTAVSRNEEFSIEEIPTLEDVRLVAQLSLAGSRVYTCT